MIQRREGASSTTPDPPQENLSADIQHEETEVKSSNTNALKVVAVYECEESKRIFHSCEERGNSFSP